MVLSYFMFKRKGVGQWYCHILCFGHGPMQQPRQVTETARRQKPSSGITHRLHSPAPESFAVPRFLVAFGAVSGSTYSMASAEKPPVFKKLRQTHKLESNR